MSWVDFGGTLLHRPFDGAFPPDYPQHEARSQCAAVLNLMLNQPYLPARSRAYAMFEMAEAGLHSFDHEAGRQLCEALNMASMDPLMKQRFIVHLHESPQVGELLLRRCGFNPAGAIRTQNLSSHDNPDYLRNMSPDRGHLNTGVRSAQSIMTRTACLKAIRAAGINDPAAVRNAAKMLELQG